MSSTNHDPYALYVRGFRYHYTSDGGIEPRDAVGQLALALGKIDGAASNNSRTPSAGFPFKSRVSVMAQIARLNAGPDYPQKIPYNSSRIRRPRGAR